MPEFQSVRTSPLGQGLFSPEEIELLMRVEFDRAQRHRYPLVCMLIAVDRLAQLQDLYGWESKDEILRAVVGLLRASTRECDSLGWLPDDRLLALFPHTPPDVAAMLARRTLAGARRLRFDREGKSLSVSLSLGVSHSAHAGCTSFETLVRVAEEGLAVADAAGGDRFVETDLYQLHEKQRAAQAKREKREAQFATAAPPVQTGAAVPSVSPGAEPADEDLGVSRQAGLDPEVLERVLKILQEDREVPAGDDLAAARLRIDVLERRILKLTTLLGLTEEELKRVAAMKGVDLGLASIYRTVQGLSADAAERERKREMMREIFHANIELRKRMGDVPARAGAPPATSG